MSAGYSSLFALWLGSGSARTAQVGGQTATFTGAATASATFSGVESGVTGDHRGFPSLFAFWSGGAGADSGELPPAQSASFTAGATAAANWFGRAHYDESITAGAVASTTWTGTIGGPQSASFLAGATASASFTTGATYESEHDLYSNTPVYAVEFTDLNNNVLFRYCTAHPLVLGDLGNEILIPISLDRECEPDRGRFALSTLQFELVDHGNDQITALISTDFDFIGLRCKFYETYWGLAWLPENRHQLFGGIVTEMTERDGVYRFTARSPLAAAINTIIGNGASTTLVTALTATDDVVHVADASAFEVGGTNQRAILIDDNIYLVDSPPVYEELPDGTWRIYGVSRSPYIVPPELTATSHDVGARVTEVIILGSMQQPAFTRHPFELFRTVLTESSKAGIGSAQIPVDDDAIDNSIVQLGSAYQMRFLLTESINAKEFLEKEILLPMAAYPTEDREGRIGIKLLQGAEAAAPLADFSDDDITERLEWIRNAPRIVNRVTYHYDHNPISNKFASTFIWEDTYLIEKYGRVYDLVIESKGIRSQFEDGIYTWFPDTLSMLLNRAQAHIARFGEAAPALAGRVLWRHDIREVADDVRVSFTEVVNMNLGVRGITTRAEITKMNLRFTDHELQLEFLLYANPRLGLAEDSMTTPLTSTPTATVA